MSNEEHQLESRTKLPTEVEEEDPFIMIAEFRLSLRQCLTLAMTFTIWMVFVQLTMFFLPLSTIFAGMLWSWMLLSGIFLTFIKKDGRPYEEYLSQWIQFRMSDRHYILRDSKRDLGSIEDANWDEIEEEEHFFNDKSY